MATPSVGIIVQLPMKIARIQPRQPWRAGAIAQSVQAVAGEAGIGRTAVAAAQGKNLARRLEWVRLPWACGAADQRQSHYREE